MKALFKTLLLLAALLAFSVIAWAGSPYNEPGRSEVNTKSITTTTLRVSGGQKVNVTTVNAGTYDLLDTDFILNVVYTSTGAVTSLTLPTAQCVDGRIVYVKDSGGNAGSNSITIDTQGSETIDGKATYVLNTDYESIGIYSDGSNWFLK